MLTSLDFLYIIIAVCILILTIFLVWVLYYVAQLLRQGHDIMMQVRKTVSEIEQSIDAIHQRISQSTHSLVSVVQECASMLRFIQEFRARKGRSKRAQK
ncbi:MAG: hypothetical protein A3B74_04035 [Candidatus Kerfeldbacteria bacterium RIFCSPHIGHO2_02_FULL_42_14]|uniref:DUF948 domain-containing protein n=1 Tax=Candidatus Kerfeldbacteria bacterium RIFCSPHIGHO2_02_FULL_42_14 TaxID=1798540 RepID=A0A1G2ARA3_9BACT|nr:MAG: hypothetical protein A3B74_04035 [Candidatus Kerfeldbacteria bacterium RIFCSPHIGHO2_02_FULL_42_14]OGY80679.1 MAG: hypothetical protein A3E60_04530 [Candidatus Kerfeldbacteria bacterium RIFCSPHIGHO2_12_FULL_42_13]OGY82606.1 MAG: hypothetical protein A3I91_04195 [Candidatus Kerfeldbacteria bacterium RIFCSPLOWO2_02_FULL_42_19]OGY85209.1 MAG: hypothetical protein A3G01_01325 [Candidatus Kerfeldbacteria bacterium RIFCSPLOWO2_12_FULL_43_9]